MASKIDPAVLADYQARKLVRTQKHPTAELYIHNYTEKVQFEGLWDEVTEQCRGLITSGDGTIVARPFRKFFNLNTAHRPETLVENLPAELPQITDKLDGSLGILYHITTMDGDTRCRTWHIATRGSFISEQSQWAIKWLGDLCRERMQILFNPEWTYLFEILYKENRIVVDYGDFEGLVLLAIIDTATGEELQDILPEAVRLGMKCANPQSGRSVENVMDWVDHLGPNEEGFVFRFSNGLRVKMKGAEYLRLHRLVTGCNARRIWECLAAGTPLDDFLERVPDEFHKWVVGVRDELLSKFNGLKVAANIARFSVADLPTRKEQALYLREHHPDVMSLAFSLLDSRDIDVQIWRTLKPEHETPFKQKETEDGN